MGETTDIIESWMRDLTNYTLTEKWTDGDSHRLVYDIGGPQNLEVHSAFFIELDGRPMMVPACVVLSGQTNFEFFDDKEGLFTVLGPRHHGRKPSGTSQSTSTQLPAIQNIGLIRPWVIKKFEEYT